MRFFWILFISLLIARDIYADNPTRVADQTKSHQPVCQAKDNQQECNATKDGNNGELGSNCFTAAIYEHYRHEKNVNDDWRKTVENNIDDFREAAKIAHANGAKIIVYPEDGVLIGTRRFVEPGLPNIPDPKALDSNNNNPCTQPEFFEGDTNLIVRNLSCIARENNIYVAANFGTKETCEPDRKLDDGRICPKKGSFAYNTDIVFGPDGAYLERYRKANLFLEIWDRSPKLETVYFDTPFGRFGIFTCFDMIFKKPAVDLVEKFQVDTILFPTWWYDEAPLLTAIQYQDGWSLRNRVNLLAANTHLRSTGSTGSGIYSGQHLSYVGSNAKNSKLVIATIPKRPRESTSCEFNPKQFDLTRDLPAQEYSYKSYALFDDDKVHVINKAEERKTVCKGEVCCTIDYKVTEASEKYLADRRLILIVRNGLRPGKFNWYEQVCSMATLTKPFDEKNLTNLEYAPEGLIAFDKLNIKGAFTTNHVYPVAAYSIPDLIDRKDRELDCMELRDGLTSCKMTFKASVDENKPIYSFGMFARLYEADKMPSGYW